MNNKISIIVPIYNTEKYLERCLQSLINQEYKNIEIILVNDGSFDNHSSYWFESNKRNGFYVKKQPHSVSDKWCL